ncbi:MAG: hypothetical protein RIS45_1438, partial [Planctomycetota bacterium]
GTLRGMLAGAPCGYVASSGLSGSLVVGVGPGVLRGVGGSIDHNLAAQLLYVQVIDSPTPVTGGGAITPIFTAIIDHKNNTSERLDAILPLGGISYSTGCVVQISSTPFVGTIIANAAILYAFR